MGRGAPNTVGYLMNSARTIGRIARSTGRGSHGGSGDSDNKLEDAARRAYSESLASAGTQGQLSILKELTLDDYMSVAKSIQEGSGSGDDLKGMVSHPEAVDEILDNAAETLQQGAEEANHY